MVLGDALQDNRSLKVLNVSNNSIDSIGCLTLCCGILENESLEKVILDGNPIGKEGANALMVCLRVVVIVVVCVTVMLYFSFYLLSHMLTCLFVF